MKAAIIETRCLKTRTEANPRGAPQITRAGTARYCVGAPTNSMDINQVGRNHWLGPWAGRNPHRSFQEIEEISNFPDWLTGPGRGIPTEAVARPQEKA